MILLVTRTLTPVLKLQHGIHFFSTNKILLGISNRSKSEVQNGNIASWYQAWSHRKVWSVTCAGCWGFRLTSIHYCWCFQKKKSPRHESLEDHVASFCYCVCGRFSQQQEKELVIRKHHPKRDQEEVAMWWGKGMVKNSQNMGWECGLFRRTSRYENPFLSTAGNFSRRRYKISRHWLGNIGRFQAFVWLLWGFDEMIFVQFHFWHMDITNLPRDDRNDWSWRGIGSAHNY